MRSVSASPARDLPRGTSWVVNGVQLSEHALNYKGQQGRQQLLLLSPCISFTTDKITVVEVSLNVLPQFQCTRSCAYGFPLEKLFFINVFLRMSTRSRSSKQVWPKIVNNNDRNYAPPLDVLFLHFFVVFIPFSACNLSLSGRRHFTMCPLSRRQNWKKLFSKREQRRYRKWQIFLWSLKPLLSKWISTDKYSLSA